MCKPFHLFMLSVLMISTLFAGSSAQAAPATRQGLSPASFLNPDGSLRLDSNYSGALDLAGWGVRLDPRRGPVFAPAAAPLPGWNALGSGLNDFVKVIAISGSDVYVGGAFTDAGGNAKADYIAKWNGSNWSALGSGLNDHAYAIAISGSNVYVGGAFANAGGNASADHIARWNGSNWSALGSGLNGTVAVITITGSTMYVGGFFTDAGGNANADFIAKWNGSNWSALGSGLSGVAGDNEISESEPCMAGNASAECVSKWDGLSWSALAGALNGGVDEITISGSDIYVGGDFTNAGGNANADRIAKWNGSNWSALGSGLNDWVYAIAIVGSNIYAGGDFVNAGGNANADYIAKWNGSNWSALGSGVDRQVITIITSASDIYVGGGFNNAGGNADANSIAKWDGSNWSALGNGLNGSVFFIAINGSNVYAGGAFDDGGGNANADNIAFYHTPSQTFRSQAAYDGHILESTETSGVGGSLNATSTVFYLGDDAQDKQYRAILSFDTSSLPDNAVISKVTLKIKKQGLAGTDPFTTHGNLLVDIRKGAFSGNNALQLTDFQAAASKNNVGSIPKTPVSGWYTKTWTSGIFMYINKAGLTQFRLRFTKDDNDDTSADYVKFYSGNAGTASYRPQLIVEYSAP